jgi:hypothetical protein
MKHFPRVNLIRVLAVWAALVHIMILLFAILFMGPNNRAVILMGTGLMVLWMVLGGTLMWKFREPIRDRVLKISLPWAVKFVLFCTILALIEEAITVSMTNLAPFFGVSTGAAYITASANYFDVVVFHSVVVFIPMFVVWAFLLSRWDFSPASVFLLFGITGFFSESIFAGTFNLPSAPFWIFVYGLMIWLPAYSLPPREKAKPPRWWIYPVAILSPYLLAVPVALIVSSLHPVSIHFPPIEPGS